MTFIMRYAWQIVEHLIKSPAQIQGRPRSCTPDVLQVSFFTNLVTKVPEIMKINKELSVVNDFN